MQNFMEYALEYIRDSTKPNWGKKEYRPGTAYCGYIISVHLCVKLVWRFPNSLVLLGCHQ
jgi:F0F1-type ATP synthase membrane subunit a